MMKRVMKTKPPASKTKIRPQDIGNYMADPDPTANLRVAGKKKKGREIITKIKVKDKPKPPKVPKDITSKKNQRATFYFNHTLKNSCYYCESHIRKDTTAPLDHALTKDHIVPRCHNGASRMSNIVYSCAVCNGLKNDLSVHQFNARVNSAIDHCEREGLDRIYWQNKRIPIDKLFLMSKNTVVLCAYVENNTDKLTRKNKFGGL